MRITTSAASAAALLLMALPGGSASASSFNLAPIRLEMDRAHQTGVLTLHNDGDAPVTIQAQPVAWSQPDGSDRYEATRELLVTPPIFVVPAHAEQIVRVARRATAAVGHEQSYRLFFEEVPEAVPAGVTGLRVALRIGIPVFFAAPAAKSDLTFSGRWTTDGTLELAAENRGGAHVQITDFELTGPGGGVIARVGGSRYVLAGATTRWSLKAAAGTARSERLKLSGHGDSGAIEADVACAAP